MLVSLILLIVGLAILVCGAEALVQGAGSLARRFGIPSIVIGLTVVAFGTSAPELAVNVFSALKGSADIAIGNVLGSNIANILLILGVVAIVAPPALKAGTIWKEVPLSLLAALLVGVVGSDLLIDGEGISAITRSDALVLLSFFVIFMYYTYGITKGRQGETGEIPTHEWAKTALYILGGIAALVVGGKLIVDAAVELARSAGLSEHLIGLTVIAVGTSLPELATSVVAALRKQPDIAVGNIVGSNVFNIFFVLGVSGLIAPLPFSPRALVDASVAAGASLLLFAAVFVGHRRRLDRWQGVAFVCAYVAYVAYAASLG